MPSLTICLFGGDNLGLSCLFITHSVRHARVGMETGPPCRRDPLRDPLDPTEPGQLWPYSVLLWQLKINERPIRVNPLSQMKRTVIEPGKSSYWKQDMFQITSRSCWWQKPVAFWFHPIVQAKISQPQATYYPWYTSWIQKNIDDIITQNHNFHRPHMSSYIQTNPKHVNISTSCHQCNWTSSGNKTKTHTFLPSGFMDIYGCSIPSIWGFPKMGVPLNHSCWFPL
jgi:hypothetical protein